VLARLNLIPGVATTSASLANPGDSESTEGSQGSSFIRVTLRSGADSKKVAEQIELILKEELREREVAAVSGQAAGQALQQREWLDTSQLADFAAKDAGIAAKDAGMPTLLWLLLAAMIVALCLVGWRYLRQRRAVAAPATS
jgi:hypothetical protein